MHVPLVQEVDVPGVGACRAACHPPRSVALPLKLMMSPALNSMPSVGERIVAVGRVPALMVSGVESVEFTPSETVSRT